MVCTWVTILGRHAYCRFSEGDCLSIFPWVPFGESTAIVYIFFWGHLEAKPSNKKIVQNFDPTKTTGKPMNFGAAGA